MNTRGIIGLLAATAVLTMPIVEQSGAYRRPYHKPKDKTFLKRRSANKRARNARRHH